jgi:ABC-2 type transport system ATP-binding protein
MIELVNLTKSYNAGAVRAVDALSLTIEPGEIFGFLGPNGAGKTTAIKMMVGILAPDSGQIKIAGVDLDREPLRAKRNIGYVPDSPDLYERITGNEYLDFLGDVYQVPLKQRQERTEKLGEAFSLTDALPDPIGSFSHGMRQKLAILGAMLPDPQVLILDEPMVGLDPKSSHLLKEILREHAQAGKTVFFSTHVLEVAERFCHRLGIIKSGKLIAAGTLEELRRVQGETLEDIFLEVTQ